MWWLACAAPKAPVDTAMASSGDTARIVDTATRPGDTASGTAGDTGSSFELTAAVEAAGYAVALRTNLPADLASCELLGADCADVDLDGLVDAWEDLVLDRLRPSLRFDEAEPLMTDAGAVLFAVGRVAPAEDGHVRVYVMNGFSSDYGRCGISAHDGDSERVVLDLSVSGGDAEVVGTYTAAHEGELTDHGAVFTDVQLLDAEFVDDAWTGEPRWRVYSSDGKHASYHTVQACEDAEWVVCLEEDCAPDGVDDETAWDRLPPVINAGEEHAPRVTDLAAIGFPDEDAWADQEFCGGLGRGSGCSSSIREKLLEDPFSTR